MSDKPNPFVVKKAFTKGEVAVHAKLKSWSYGNGIRIEASAQITTAQARELAAALIEYADREDAKVAADKAREDRRKAWRDREVAAGRMKVFTMKEFLGHG